MATTVIRCFTLPSPLLLSLLALLAHTHAQSTAEMAQCRGIGGNPDMYGIGIRVGFYLQLLACMLAAIFQQSSYWSIYYASLFFQLSMLVGVIYLTDTNSAKFEAGEVVVITCLLLFNTSFTARLFAKTKYIRRRIVLTSKTIVDLASTCYSLWFWYVGLERFPRAECAVYGSRWLRGYMKFFSLLIAVYQLLQLYELLQLRFDSSEASECCRCSPSCICHPDRLERCEKFKKFVIDRFRITMVFLAVGVTVFCIYIVERLINSNRIGGVSASRINNVGQLIPFLVGIGSFLSFFMEWKTPASPKSLRDVWRDLNFRRRAAIE